MRFIVTVQPWIASVPPQLSVKVCVAVFHWPAQPLRDVEPNCRSAEEKLFPRRLTTPLTAALPVDTIDAELEIAHRLHLHDALRCYGVEVAAAAACQSDLTIAPRDVSAHSSIHRRIYCHAYPRFHPRF
jgi:hypothetical protein